jgi:hypothetical protein
MTDMTDMTDMTNRHDRHDKQSDMTDMTNRQTDRQTDMTTLTVTFGHFAVSPKDCSSSNYHSGLINDAGNMDRDAVSIPTFRKTLSNFHSRPQRT